MPIIYLIFINLAAFLLMGVDKYKAIRHRWRISEKTLFLGMYTFRHKTRHASFVYGMPVILILQIILVCALKIL